MRDGETSVEIQVRPRSIDPNQTGLRDFNRFEGLESRLPEIREVIHAIANELSKEFTELPPRRPGTVEFEELRVEVGLTLTAGMGIRLIEGSAAAAATVAITLRRSE